MTENRKTHALFPSNRKAEIGRFLDEVGQATVSELAEKFGVSRDTVRRDLEDLSSEGIVLRQHGGAISTRYHSSSEYPIPQRIGENSADKLRIGREAARLIEDGMTVLLNGGSTVLTIVEHLRAFKDLVIVTNNLMLPQMMQDIPVRELWVIGGVVRPLSQVTLGPVAFLSSKGAGIHGLRADISFIGVGGVSVQGGLTTSNIAEAAMLKEFIDASNRVVIVADKSKIGKIRFAHIAPLTDMDVIVTDHQVPSEMEQQFLENRIQMVIA